MNKTFWCGSCRRDVPIEKKAPRLPGVKNDKCLSCLERVRQLQKKPKRHPKRLRVDSIEYLSKLK